MRNEREPLLAALSGFLVGVLFTLVVVEFIESTKLPYQLAILVALAMIAAVAIASFLLFPRRQLSSTSAMATSRELPVSTSPSIEYNPAPTGAQVIQTGVASASPERSDRRRGMRSSSPQPHPGRPVVTTLETPLSDKKENYSVWHLEEEDLPSEPVPARAASYVTADSGGLVEVWESYRKLGDGTFTVSGLRQRLEAAGIKAEVVSGEQMGVGDCLLAVDFRRGGPLYLVPDFNKSAWTVSQWFQALGSASRTAVIQRLIRPATARRSGGGLTVETKGEIE